jgi:quercetin dioxygenase-like cupin family protein
MMQAGRSTLVVALLGGAMTVALASETAKRLTPEEITALPSIEAGAGTSGVAGMRTTVLAGDPSKPGLYTIQISVPPHTTIQAHHHRDDRIATVISGLWYIGYGEKRADSLLKEMPAGSFYTEPGGTAHFAGTKDQPAVVRITGFGPSDTVYVDAANAPRAAPH